MSSSSIFLSRVGSPGMMAADAATLRSASRCCQSRIKPASLASCPKKALGPAVALAERVDGVDLTEVVGQPFGEHVSGKSAQEALAMHRSEDLRRQGLDVLRQAKPGSLRNGDGPQLPDPVVDVTEDPAIDDAELLSWWARTRSWKPPAVLCRR
jgi:hypothetical protein